MIFDCPKGMAKRDEDAGEGASNRPNKKKNKQRREGSLMATTNCKGVRSPSTVPQTTSRSYRRTMPEPCFPHQAPIQGLRHHEAVLVWRLQQGGA